MHAHCSNNMLACTGTTAVCSREKELVMATLREALIESGTAKNYIESEIARKDKIFMSVEKQIRKLSKTWDSIDENYEKLNYLKDLKRKLSSEIDILASKIA